jgi:hypothetical protein
MVLNVFMGRKLSSDLEALRERIALLLGRSKDALLVKSGLDAEQVTLGRYQALLDRWAQAIELEKDAREGYERGQTPIEHVDRAQERVKFLTGEAERLRGLSPCQALRD